MIRIFIFCYGGNGAETIECARCAREAMPMADIRIIDDSRDAIAPSDWEILQCEGINIVASDFDRVGNLNGGACIKGMLGFMRAFSKPGDIIIKIDPDTAVLSADWMMPLEDKRIVYVASGDERQAAYGCCYAMRAEAVNRLLGEINSGNLIIPERAPEDVFIAQSINHIYGRQAMHIHAPWTPDNTDARWTAFCWQSMLATPEVYADRFDVITTGNIMHPEHPVKSRAECMRRLREERQVFQSTHP